MGKATYRMIDFATDIADELCMEDELDEMLDSDDNFDEISEFIDEKKMNIIKIKNKMERRTKMDNIKDKLIEIAKKAIASNAEVFEDNCVTLNDNDFDNACEEIADGIIENLYELLVDSDWVKLPCKVGDIVYVIIQNKVYEAECNYIDINRIGKTWVDLAPTLYPTEHTVYNIQDLNEAWFLTQAEAEAKLAEPKGDKK